MPSVTMNVLHLLVVLVNVVHALRDQKAMPLIYDEFDGEIAKDDNVHSSQKTASHLEIQETAAADVDRLNHSEHLDLFIPKMEVVTKELAEAKELQLDHLDCNGTLPLSGYFKVSTKLIISQRCNITADGRGAMLFLEAPLHFNESVEFHGNLSVIAVRQPLDGPCVRLEKDGIVRPGAALRFANCHRRKGSGGAMLVLGNFFIHGDVHIRNCSASRGGAIYVEKTFTQSDGTLTIANSLAGVGGAIWVRKTFTQSNGTLTIANSLAEGSGGAIYVQNTFTQSDGTVIIVNSSAIDGGAICVRETFTQSDGTLTIEDSSSRRCGGAIWVRKTFTQSNGTLTIANSLAKWSGGAIYIEKTFTQSDGTLKIANSLAEGSGGAIYVEKTFTQSDGTLTIANSLAEGTGGAIYVMETFTQSDGTLTIENSLSAKQDGGAIHVQNTFTQSDGTLTIANSLAEGSGGAIYVRETFTQSDGTLTIENSSSAKQDGGAIHVLNTFTQSDGTLTIANSLAEGSGGAIYVRETFTQSDGTLTIESSSSAEQDGGAIYVMETFTQSDGTLTIENSSAEQYGGAMTIGGNFTLNKGNLSVRNATAKIGGGMFVFGDVVLVDAAVSFHQCHAWEDGGGIRAIGNVDATNTTLLFVRSTTDKGQGAALMTKDLNQHGGNMVILNNSAGQEIISVANWTADGAVRLEHCRSATFLMSVHQASLTGVLSGDNCTGAAGTLVSQGPVTLRNAVFNKTSAPQVRAPEVEARNWTVAGTEAWISSSTVSYLDKIDCDPVFGGLVTEDGAGCKTCDPGLTFVKRAGPGVTVENKTSWQQCRNCPGGAATCNATAVHMSPGLMVDVHDITRSLHCPNPLACPGGLLSANESKPMCDSGYDGPGCSKCASDFARTDSNVFICMTCATDTLSKVKELLVFVGNDALIFAISAAGVISAQGRNKNSAVFLNQLMAFAAVIAPALLALKQTKTLKDQLKWLQQLLLAASLPIQVGDGESSTAVSTECLLMYFGLEASLVSAQVLSSLVYTMLGLVLAFKSGWRVALVVAVNCFMPKFCAAFGKYLICYRMEPASKQDEMYCLLGDHWVPGMVIAMAAILLCFLVGPGSWLRMVRDKNRREEAQVLYLTRSYQKGYETIEVERLLRKMLLKLICTTLPITLNPSMQMTCLSLVLTASWGLHSSNSPYVKASWNHMEQGLLATALVIIILTSFCLANENHWAHSAAVQITLIVLVAGLVTVAGTLQSVLLIRELIRERRPPELIENEDDITS